MKESTKLQIKITGSPELVSRLSETELCEDEYLEVISFGENEQPSHLRFGLVEVASLVAIANGVVMLGKFAHGIYRHLTKNSDQRISIQTPLSRIEITSSEAISEERVRELVNQLFT